MAIYKKLFLLTSQYLVREIPSPRCDGCRSHARCFTNHKAPFRSAFQRLTFGFSQNFPCSSTMLSAMRSTLDTTALRASTLGFVQAQDLRPNHPCLVRLCNDRRDFCRSVRRNAHNFFGTSGVCRLKGLPAMAKIIFQLHQPFPYVTTIARGNSSFSRYSLASLCVIQSGAESLPRYPNRLCFRHV